MGTWGVGIFSNDDAADLREDFRDLIASGLAADEAAVRSYRCACPGSSEVVAL
jgi:hypothetical protein